MKDNKDLKTISKQFTPPPVPQTQEVRYIETEDLYPDLVHEDISSSRGHGPCFDYNCRCTKQQLRGQIRQLENKMSSAPDTACFRLGIGFRQNRLWNWHIEGCSSDWITMYSVSDARETLRKFDNGTYATKGATGASNTPNARIKNKEVTDYIRNCISRSDRGESVNDDKDFNY